MCFQTLFYSRAVSVLLCFLFGYSSMVAGLFSTMQVGFSSILYACCKRRRRLFATCLTALWMYSSTEMAFMGIRHGCPLCFFLSGTTFRCLGFAECLYNCAWHYASLAAPGTSVCNDSFGKLQSSGMSLACCRLKFAPFLRLRLDKLTVRVSLFANYLLVSTLSVQYDCIFMVVSHLCPLRLAHQSCSYILRASMRNGLWNASASWRSLHNSDVERCQYMFVSACNCAASCCAWNSFSFWYNPFSLYTSSTAITVAVLLPGCLRVLSNCGQIASPFNLCTFQALRRWTQGCFAGIRACRWRSSRSCRLPLVRAALGVRYLGPA